MNRSLAIGFSLAAFLAAAATALGATPAARHQAGDAPASATPAPTHAEPVPSAQPEQSAPVTVEDGLPRQPTLLERQVIAAQEGVDELRFRSDHVQQLLRSARHARFQERVECLDDMLSQAHAVERDADHAIHTASQSAEKDDSYAVERELVHLWIYDLRSRTIALEADQCGGVEAQFSSR